MNFNLLQCILKISMTCVEFFAKIWRVYFFIHLQLVRTSYYALYIISEERMFSKFRY